ncbi:MAG: hypothetical protein QXP04_01190 [Candidatus Nanoarchaeia archaeon]|nr:hypothetical protein [Candidatus Jingweiarchaeum tengchongense]
MEREKGNEYFIRVIADTREEVVLALEAISKCFKVFTVTGIKQNLRDPGYRGYAYAKEVKG